jgi:hypothetical protein
VIAAIAVIPCTPQRANALMSAWMPAPPPESEPAIESAVGVCFCAATARTVLAHAAGVRPPAQLYRPSGASS